MYWERMKRLRVEKGVAQKDVARVIGVAPSTYTLYENGKREPDFSTLIAIASYFNVSCDYLLTGVDTLFIDICKQTVWVGVASAFHDPLAQRLLDLLEIETVMPPILLAGDPPLVNPAADF